MRPPLLLLVLLAQLAEAPEAARKTLGQYDQVTAETGPEHATPYDPQGSLDTALLLSWLRETNTNTMNFLLYDTDGHQYLDMVRFLELTKDQAIAVWVTLIPPSETASSFPAQPPPHSDCATCPRDIGNPYGDAVHGIYCCNGTISGGSCGAGVPVCCIFPGSGSGCQGVPRCGNNTQNKTLCEVSQCSVPADSPLTAWNESELVNASLGFRGCNDYVGWGHILSRLAGQYPAVKACNIDDYVVSLKLFTQTYSAAIRDALHGGGGGGATGSGSSGTRGCVKFIPTFYYWTPNLGNIKSGFVLREYAWLNNVTDGALFYYQGVKAGQTMCRDSPVCKADPHPPSSCKGPGGQPWACLWNTCSEASVPGGLLSEIADFEHAMPPGNELHVGLYFSGYGPDPCRAVPSVKYAEVALETALASPAVSGAMVYLLTPPAQGCPSATDRGCVIRTAFGAAASSSPPPPRYQCLAPVAPPSLSPPDPPLIPASSSSADTRPPLECQSFASHPTWPLYHIMQEVAKNETDGTVQLAKGGINDANAIFKHGEYYHVMHQDHSNGSSWGHLVSRDLAHWTRIGMVIPPHDPYGVGQEGQCDGSFSSPAGIGPVIMWTPDCDIGPIRPPHPPSPPSSGSSVRVGGPDRPRVAVAFPRTSSDPLLREFVMQPELADFGESVPGGDPGRVFKSEKGDYWNTLMCYNGTWPTTLARYTSTDPKLLKWTLADHTFASIVDDATGKTLGAVGAIAPAMFYALPGAPKGTFIINSMEGEQWAVGTYDPQTEKMTVNRSASHERPVTGGRAWHAEGDLSGTFAEYLFTATGPAGETVDGSDRLLQIGWVWKGDWKRDASPNRDSVDLLSLIYDLRFDATIKKLVAEPVPEYSALHNNTLVAKPRVSLPAGTATTLPLAPGAGSTVEIRLSLPVPTSADASAAIGLALLAPNSVAEAKADAAQLWLNISAATPRNGSRFGKLNLTNHNAPPNIGTVRVAAATFEVLAGEANVELRVFIDRVMIEASAMHGRAMLIAEEYRPVPASAVHLLAPVQQAAMIKNLTVWSMSCGMAPLK